MSEPEWQFFGDDNWIFGVKIRGVKIRGVIRDVLAEVYFAEEVNGPEGSWSWMVHQKKDMAKWRERGLARSFQTALVSCEKAMGIE